MNTQEDALKCVIITLEHMAKDAPLSTNLAYALAVARDALGLK